MPAPKSSIQPAPLHLPQMPPVARARAATEDTGYVEFDRRLGKRKIAGAETCFDACTKKLFNKIFDRAGEIAKGDVGVDREAFDLMKHEGVRGVRIVAPIDFARHNDAHGGLALLQGANLHRRGVRAKQQRAGSAFGQFEIKRVHVVANGMVLGNVQRFEIVVRRLDFGAFDDREANGKEDIFDFLEDLADQVMEPIGRMTPGRERSIRSFALAAVASAPASMARRRASIRVST